MLAWDNRATSVGLAYFMPVLDLKGRGYLTQVGAPDSKIQCILRLCNCIYIKHHTFRWYGVLWSDIHAGTSSTCCPVLGHNKHLHSHALPLSPHPSPVSYSPCQLLYRNFFNLARMHLTVMLFTATLTKPLFSTSALALKFLQPLKNASDSHVVHSHPQTASIFQANDIVIGWHGDQPPY